MQFPLTLGIVFLNALLFLLSALVGRTFVGINLETLVNFGALYGPLVVLKGEWWRLVSAMFLHGGMTHLLMNMASLYIVGRGVERFFSKTAYITIYLFAGLVGGIASLYMHPQSVGIGASGAIFGVVGALGGFFLAHRDRMAAYGREMMKDFAAILGLNLLLGLAVPSIDMSAHIGGLLIGFAGGFFVGKNPRNLVWFTGISAIILLLGIVYLRYYYVQIFM